MLRHSIKPRQAPRAMFFFCSSTVPGMFPKCSENVRGTKHFTGKVGRGKVEVSNTGLPPLLEFS